METNTKPTFKRSVDSVTLANRFSKMQIGDVISYAEMQALVRPMDIQTKNRNILYSACRIVRDEYGIVMSCVNGVGMKRLSDSEIADIPDYTFGQIRRKTKNATKSTKCADFTKLSTDEKKKLWFGQSMLGALCLMTSPKKIKELKSVSVVSQQFSIDTLKELVVKI